ncbi:MAG: hypothetical protein E6Q99_09165 [Elusimicrobia bacterium]|jgi:alpha-ketoglutarate-dependent taurine dioxygenase|nr:TauD/TfdA family dioxygenase [Steroidobacteraceae bacterium]TXH22242.1 MAG: hypothetical protein E6Q99_09165 [Elusimicrobiota bacterium]
MKWDPDALLDRGYDVMHGTGAAAAMVDGLAQLGYRVGRDVVIGPPGSGVLLPHEGDFWHHTDGTFFAVPPRWVIIEVLRADRGGALHVFDAASLARELDSGTIWYGTELGGVFTSVVTEIDGRPCIRYRADYMHACDDPDRLAAVHARIARHAATSAIEIGELPPSSCLVTDNWRVLHRRAAFTGERTIRRLWLSPSADIA